MSDDLDRLRAGLKAMRAPDERHKRDAIHGGLEAFEKKFQGSGVKARPTVEQPRWWVLATQGANSMLKRLKSREAVLATATLATIAVAVVITGEVRRPPFASPAALAVPQSATTPPRTAETAAPKTRSLAVTGQVAADFVAQPTPMVLAERISRAPESREFAPVNTERFANADINSLKVTQETPVSTFSIDVDTASYAFVRAALMGGQLPPPDAVRTEEMINYFSYAYPAPETPDVPFSISVTVMDTPWNSGTRLLHIGIKGFDLPLAERPAVNLVFLIDTSGSMMDANKLPLLVNAFRLMLGTLGPDDKVAIVTYAGRAGTVLEPTPASEKDKILASLGALTAGGSTAGQAGLQQAYALAEQMASDGATSRVILATDGDFNVGISDREALKSYVEQKRKGGVYLSVLGFGRGNYNDALMQTLAQNGNGTAAYIDTLAEAQKVLVDQVAGALFPIADDVKIQVEFNPAMVAEYRLIGYETRGLDRADFSNDAVDAGEIGAGHTVTALYEITPVGSSAVRVGSLRYGTSETGSVNTGEYAFLKLRYKLPGEATSRLVTTPVTPNADAGIDSEVRFAAAVAAFGQILRGDTMMNGYTLARVETLARENRGPDPFGYRAGFLALVRLAESLE